MTNFGPLFERAADRVTAAVPAASRALLKELLGEPAQDPERLLNACNAYMKKLEELHRTREFLDIESARVIASRCEGLLLQIGQSVTSEEHHMLIQAAVRYFVEEHDAEKDLDSPIGFDDDLVVLEVVVAELRDRTGLEFSD